MNGKFKLALGVVFAALYVSTIVVANWAVDQYGIVPVGFGLAAPAAVYFAGLAFTLRDLTQKTIGKWAVLGVILAGSGVSYYFGSRFAVAAGIAFLLSELVDFGVFLSLEKHIGTLWAMAVSNVFGLVIDSYVFLKVAPAIVPIPGFDNMTLFSGQVVGKAWVTAPLVVLAVANAIRNNTRELEPA